MKMEIEAAGTAAQMQVIDLDAQVIRPLATMEYFKATKVIFMLRFQSEPNTGVAKG